MAGMTSDAFLFHDRFTIDEINDKKYDRCERLYGKNVGNSSEDGEPSSVVIELDVNKELFPTKVGDSVDIVIASTLNLDGTKEDDKGWRDDRKRDDDKASLADNYDYVCHGKVYKFEDGSDGQTITAYISFGGLLMKLEGPYKRLTPLRVDYVYLLVKK
ncbi:hypothetical protein B0T24DRAFT_176689 [Lasiosphaeria ovina]|uniref:DNA-directed RNA polymerases I, II, and III subunit RPABC3 n=1 Tax=Lasiosphaeria ovina TaxID=92902 RepID=A0AAE0NEG2_9PEZI|nr:hypothetical protein B0T24DRAFT_176689 [Lasiosphaeria ovina]